MSKPTQNIDDYTVNNFYPEALLVFISIDKNGKPIRNLSSAFTTIPDISDITETQLTLGSTGKLGKFAVRINNANNKYFIADDMVTEIANLKKDKNDTFYSTADIKDSKDGKERESVATWASVQDFLNNEAFPRVYEPGTNDAHICLIYQEGANYKYKMFPKDPKDAEASSTPPPSGENPPESASTTEDEAMDAATSISDPLTAKAAQEKKIQENETKGLKERLALQDYSLSAPEVDRLRARSKRQSAFFEDYGGQLENGRCVFAPMQLMVCLLTRRFKDKDDPEDMIVAFTGFIDSVSEEYDGKTSMLRIQGTDVSKVMHITQANVNPSLFENVLPGGGQYKVWQDIFAGQQGWEIIKTLIIGGKDEAGHAVHGCGHFEYNATCVADSSTAGGKVAKSALLNGLKFQSVEWNDNVVNDKLNTLFFSPGRVHVQILPFEVSPKGLRDLSVYKKIFGASFKNWQNEYRSHLEIANEVAQLSNYEFYADQFGDLWYHQPRFHNYHILTHDNPEIYIMRDEDIVTYQFTESDKDVISSVYVAGQPNYVDTAPQIMKMTGFYEDVSLLRKYGRRMVSISHPYITDTSDCFYFAKSWMTRVNASRFVGSMTILGRPELRVHMPVYIPARNMIYYITEISHKFIYGQVFTTSLTLKYGRKPWEILPEILDYGIPDKMSAENQDAEPGDLESVQKENGTSSEGKDMPVEPDPSPVRDAKNTPIGDEYPHYTPGVQFQNTPRHRQ